MKQTTLGYIEYNGAYLMLYRNKKENDPNQGKWIGIGGHLEAGETPDECFVREVMEETGISITEFEKAGEIEFISDIWDDEVMHLYRGCVKSGYFSDCNEGSLKWIPKENIMSLNLWEGDRIFLKELIEGKNNINLKLIYKGDALVSVEQGMKTVKVVAAIIRNNNKIFATQRGYGEFKGGWEFPGGKVEAGETPEAALIREIQEELDTTISVGEKVYCVEYDYPTFHLSMECFWAEIISGDLVLKEHEAARWLSKDELRSVNWLPADWELIEKIKEKM